MKAMNIDFSRNRLLFKNWVCLEFQFFVVLNKWNKILRLQIFKVFFFLDYFAGRCGSFSCDRAAERHGIN
jgi:hypothetical protein